jgi:hypothetical protein
MINVLILVASDVKTKLTEKLQISVAINKRGTGKFTNIWKDSKGKHTSVLRYDRVYVTEHVNDRIRCNRKFNTDELLQQ